MSEVLIVLLAILIPACASSSLEFRMMYSAYKLNKQGDNIQTWCTPFSIWNQFVIPCLVLTVTSWPACRFLRRQVRWSDISYSLMYNYGCFALLYGRNQHNIVKTKKSRVLLLKQTKNTWDAYFRQDSLRNKFSAQNHPKAYHFLLNEGDHPVS